MNPSTPEPEGSKRLASLDADLMAACLPGEAGATHWACGMPLSYVQEMASRWLDLHEHTAWLCAPSGDRDPNKCSRAE